jgi:hypothetical protein
MLTVKPCIASKTEGYSQRDRDKGAGGRGQLLGACAWCRVPRAALSGPRRPVTAGKWDTCRRINRSRDTSTRGSRVRNPLPMTDLSGGAQRTAAGASLSAGAFGPRVPLGGTGNLDFDPWPGAPKRVR